MDTFLFHTLEIVLHPQLLLRKAGWRVNGRGGEDSDILVVKLAMEVVDDKEERKGSPGVLTWNLFICVYQVHVMHSAHRTWRTLSRGPRRWCRWSLWTTGSNENYLFSFPFSLDLSVAWTKVVSIQSLHMNMWSFNTLYIRVWALKPVCTCQHKDIFRIHVIRERTTLEMKFEAQKHILWIKLIIFYCKH